MKYIDAILFILLLLHALFDQILNESERKRGEKNKMASKVRVQVSVQGVHHFLEGERKVIGSLLNVCLC